MAVPRSSGSVVVGSGVGYNQAAAAFRIGHTLLSPTLLRLDADGLEIPGGHIMSFRDADANHVYVMDQSG